MNNIWQLQEAKSKFCELIERTLKQGVQVVTRRGQRVVVMLPFEEYERLTQKKENLSSFLLSSPLAGSDLIVERDKSLLRNVEIEP